MEVGTRLVVQTGCRPAFRSAGASSKERPKDNKRKVVPLHCLGSRGSLGRFGAMIPVWPLASERQVRHDFN